jgi:hypothetical protein
MKTFAVLAVSIVLVSILFCPMVIAGPPMPDDVQIVQPDPSLPKELSAFFGKWEAADTITEYFLIVEKINEEKASLYWWNAYAHGLPSGWIRYEGNVIKDRGKYKVQYNGHWGIHELTLKGKDLYLQTQSPVINPRFTQVP